MKLPLILKFIYNKNCKEKSNDEIIKPLECIYNQNMKLSCVKSLLPYHSYVILNKYDKIIKMEENVKYNE